MVKPGVFSKAPMLFIHGDADDYTPIGPCQDYADKIGKAGTPVEFVVIEGAHHKFDADDLKRYYLRGATRTKADCPLEIDIDTLYAYDRTSGARLQGDAYTAMHQELQRGRRHGRGQQPGARQGRAGGDRLSEEDFRTLRLPVCGVPAAAAAASHFV